MDAATIGRNLSFEGLCETVAPIAEKYGADSIYLFGSRARGDNTDDSDYDFYVILGQIKGMKLCGLFRELEETLGRGIDIVTDGARLGDDFSQEIFREMRLVYES
ncbi:MAG: nucleotidyltransferase domain-containing protein [Candidatus Methanoplasma sp.]|jgi:predicted nucleotidyltransferase|nr:nucleotidyltransferase domain-containing protein [Candidatus Methanoplasma sp.]